MSANVNVFENLSVEVQCNLCLEVAHFIGCNLNDQSSDSSISQDFLDLYSESVSISRNSSSRRKTCE